MRKEKLTEHQINILTKKHGRYSKTLIALKNALDHLESEGPGLNDSDTIFFTYDEPGEIDLYETLRKSIYKLEGEINKISKDIECSISKYKPQPAKLQQEADGVNKFLENFDPENDLGFFGNLK